MIETSNTDAAMASPPSDDVSMINTSSVDVAVVNHHPPDAQGVDYPIADVSTINHHRTAMQRASHHPAFNDIMLDHTDGQTTGIQFI